MQQLAPSDTQQSQLVAGNLAAAWKFLSGEDRQFTLSRSGKPPHFEELSWVVQISIPKLAMQFLVCVMIDRADALLVTRHMFGLDDDSLTSDDVNDAAAEVCNVLSCATTANLQGFETGSVPAQIDEAHYHQLCQKHSLYEVYHSTPPQGGQDGTHVIVLVPRIDS